MGEVEGGVRLGGGDGVEVAELLLGGVDHFAFSGLAGFVLGFELGGDVGGALAGGGGEEFDGFVGVAHATGGVDAWREGEADGGGVEFLSAFAVVIAGGDDEGFESGEAGAGELGEAVFDEDAVFTGEWDDVGDGAEGGEGGEFEEEVAVDVVDAFGVAEFLGDGPGEFEGDAGAAEVGVGVGGEAGEAGVDDEVGIGESGGEFVVVGDDDVNVMAAGEGDGFEGGAAAVDGDEEICAVVDGGLDGVAVEAVAFIDAVGDVGMDIGGGGGEGVPEHGGAGDAIDVVVAVEGDFFLVADGGGDAVGGDVDVGEEGRGGEIFELGIEEGEGGGGVGDAAVEEEAGDEGGDLEFAGEGREEGRGVGGIGKGGRGNDLPFAAAVGCGGRADHP